MPKNKKRVAQFQTQPKVKSDKTDDYKVENGNYDIGDADNKPASIIQAPPNMGAAYGRLTILHTGLCFWH